MGKLSELCVPLSLICSVYVNYHEPKNFHVGKYRVEIICVGKFSWLISPAKISHRRNFTQYDPARVRLRDWCLRMNTRENAYSTRRYRKNLDGTMGED